MTRLEAEHALNLEGIFNELHDVVDKRFRKLQDTNCGISSQLNLLGVYQGRIYSGVLHIEEFMSNQAQAKTILELYRRDLLMLAGLTLVMKYHLYQNQLNIKNQVHLMSQYFEALFEERIAQHQKWGEQNHAIEDWLMILSEEIGEANKHALQANFCGYEFNSDNYQQYIEELTQYGEELTQVGAVAVAMVESLERNEFRQIGL